MCTHARCRYTEHEFDKDFIEVLYEQCFLAIQNHGSATIEEVMDAIKESVSLAAGPLLRSIGVHDRARVRTRLWHLHAGKQPGSGWS